MLFAVLAMAAAVAGQDKAAPDPRGDVVVTARRDTRQDAREFVRSVDALTGTDPLARFDGTAMCPMATGLSEAHNQGITARMRRVAAAAGIELAAEGCKANVLVLITGDKARTIEALKAKFPVFFHEPSGRAIDLPPQPGPVTAWQLTVPVDRRGIPLTYDPESRYYTLDSPEGGSLVEAATRRIALGAIVVIEVNALVGLTETEIADYAAMRAYAPTNPRRLKDSSAPTILAAVDAPEGGTVPLSLTEWDLSYLRALYGTGAYHSAYRQRADIARQIAKDLERSASGK